jgi:hypothetical protein
MWRRQSCESPAEWQIIATIPWRGCRERDRRQSGIDLRHHFDSKPLGFLAQVGQGQIGIALPAIPVTGCRMGAGHQGKLWGQRPTGGQRLR